MSARSWIFTKIQENKEKTYTDGLETVYSIREGIDDNTIVVEYADGGSPVLIACLERSSTEFTPAALDTLLAESPEINFVVGTQQSPVAHATYGHADAIGVGIGALGDLLYALRDPNPPTAKTSDRSFIENGLNSHARVSSFHRISKRAYEVFPRPPAVRVRRFIIVKSYELTAEEVNSLVVDHKGLGIDAIVSSNPAADDFSQDALETAELAGIELFTWRQFLRCLGR